MQYHFFYIKLWDCLLVSITELCYGKNIKLAQRKEALALHRGSEVL